MAKLPVTLTDIVVRNVSLEIEGSGRLYLNGRVPSPQTSGQVAGWLHYRGFPIASPAALGKNKELLVQAVRRYADSNQIPWALPGGRRADRRGEGGRDRGGPRVPVGLRRHQERIPGRGAVVCT
jgi:hypothetical protein